MRHKAGSFHYSKNAADEMLARLYAQAKPSSVMPSNLTGFIAAIDARPVANGLLGQ